ncbi:MAG TPA: RNA polymerase sigma factor [Mycobacteriales bacterium]|nr:RNA polymerase sigma factor [Mycobacteriales bacterium]
MTTAPVLMREASISTPDFRELYDRDYPRVAAYCFQLVRDREVAADLAQEAFARLFARWLSVRQPTAYVFHIATNLVRAHWSARARDVRALPLLDAGRDTVEGADLAVRDAVDRLPQRYRELVLLHYYTDLTVPDVARAVRRPEGSVKRMLSEARGLLAIALEDSRV